MLQAKIGLWECDLRTGELAWTAGVYDLFELPRDARVTRAAILEFYHPEDLPKMEVFRAKAIRDHVAFCLDVRIRTAKGSERWMRLTGDVECEDGIAVRLLGVKQDITRDRAEMDALKRAAESDPLTGLANRFALEASLHRSDDVGHSAMVLIDLDGFKSINDTFGHLAGDTALRVTGSRLRDASPSAWMTARLGGDEFAVLIGPGVSREAIVSWADAIIASLNQPIVWNGCDIRVGASVGIALPDIAAISDPQLLFATADLALYAAKRCGRNRWSVRDADAGKPMGFPTQAYTIGMPLQFDLFDAGAAVGV